MQFLTLVIILIILTSLPLVALFFSAKSKHAKKITLYCLIIGAVFSVTFVGWSAYYSQADYEEHKGDCCSPSTSTRDYKLTVCARCHHDLDDSPLHTLNVLAPYIYGVSLAPLYIVSTTTTIKSRKNTKK